MLRMPFGGSDGNLGDDPSLTSHTYDSHTCSTPPLIAGKTEPVPGSSSQKALREQSSEQPAQELLISYPIWPGAVEVERKSKQILSKSHGCVHLHHASLIWNLFFYEMVCDADITNSFSSQMQTKNSNKKKKPVLELALVDQCGFKLTEFCLPFFEC